MTDFVGSKTFVILSSLRSGRVEGRGALVQ
jgi:hypothetical protein